MTRYPGDSPAAFAAWVVVGAGLALGVLTILTIGPFVFLVTFVVCGVLFFRSGFGYGMTGLVSGAGVPLLWVGWLNRGGPGTVCTSTASASSCVDEWPPWPFVVAAVILFVTGIVLYIRLQRR